MTLDLNSRKGELLILAGILLLFFVLRAPGLTKPIAGEESPVLRPFVMNDGHIPAHPLLTNALVYGSYTVFGEQDWALRLPFLVFGLLSFLLVYKIGKTFFSTRVAQWASLIMVLSPAAVVASLLLLTDGAVLEFFVIAAFYAYLMYERTENKNWFALCGAFIGLAFLTKVVAVVSIGALALYVLVKTKDIKKTVKHTSGFILVGLIAALLFVLLDYIYSGGTYSSSILNRAFSTVSNPVESLNTPALYFVKMRSVGLVFLTPLLLFGFFQYWKTFGRSGFKNVFALQALVALVFFYLIVPSTFEIARFMFVATASLSLITAQAITSESWSSKKVGLLAVLGLLFFAAFAFLNQGPYDLISYDFPASILARVVALDFSFYYPVYLVFSGARFLLSMPVLFLGFGASAVLFVAGLVWKPKRAALFLVLLAIGFAFSAFASVEYIYHPTTPDYDETSRALITYVQTHDVAHPLYSSDIDVIDVYFPGEKKMYTTGVGMCAYERDVTRVAAFEQDLAQRGGTIMLVDMPVLSKESPCWKLLEQCSVVYTVEEKGITSGYVFTCAPEGEV